jgi:hypothetical protein
VTVVWEPLRDVLRAAGIEYELPEHHEAGRVLPDDANRGSTWACSCGRLFPTQKARSLHFHNANNSRRRRMGI